MQSLSEHCCSVPKDNQDKSELGIADRISDLDGVRTLGSVAVEAALGALNPSRTGIGLSGQIGFVGECGLPAADD